MPAPTPQDIQSLSRSLTQIASDKNEPDEARVAAFEASKKVAPLAFSAALADFRRGTVAFFDVAQDIAAATASLEADASPKLNAVLAEIARIHAAIHDPEGMRTTWESATEFGLTFKDEARLAPDGALGPVPTSLAGFSRLDAPAPVDSRDFIELENEYLRFFAGMEWKNADARGLAHGLAKRALRCKPRYDAVGAELKIPWWFIACVHLLESSFNFGTHLHNGDSLKDRTFRVPAGRPEAGDPPFTWEESAKDALERRFAGLTDWSLARSLYRWEAYNGFGYRSRGVPTPYLWSMSTIYTRGKFIGDGVFSATAVSKQCGAAALLRALVETGADDVAVQAELRPEGDGDGADNAAADVEAVAAGDAPNVDGAISPNIDFKDWFEANLSDVTDFKWHEFLVKGASHASNGLNTDPPRSKWANVIPLARTLQAIRNELGHPMVLTSCYRSPAYNKDIGGAEASQHMHFCAADFQVPGHGSAADWHRTVKRLRDSGLFSGGIGKYNSFVHVDTRGVNADW